MSGGSLGITVPAGWTAPRTTAGAGFVAVSTGTLAVAGQQIQVTGLTLAAAATITVTYGSGGGANLPLAGTTAGANTISAVKHSTTGIGSAVATTSQPATINVYDANNAGAIAQSAGPSNVANGVVVGSAITWTFTAGAGGMSGGSLGITVPAGWTAPRTTAGAGFVAVSTGTLAVAGQQIQVTGLTLAAAATITVTYGSGGGANLPLAGTTAGANTISAVKHSTTGIGSAVATTSQPASINVYDANNAGAIAQTAGPSNVANGVVVGSAITWTFTAGAGGMSGGSLGITVPAGWTAPRTTAGAGFVAVSTGTLAVAGQQIQVTGLTLAAAATITVTYGSGGGANLPLAGTTAGANTISAVKHSTTGIGSAVATTSQPASINVYDADGSGAIGVSPTSAVAGSTGNTLTFTYTAAAGGISGGTVELTVPAGWTAPQTASSTSAGYTTASGGSGTNAIAWSGGTRKLTISDVTLSAAGTLTVIYGANAGSGGGATAPTSTGAAATWTTQQKSTSGGTLTNLAASPSVTINPGSLSDFLVEAAGGGAIGTQTAGVAFNTRVTARDTFGNTVTSYNGAGNTVDITSTSAISAGGGTTGTFTNGVLASHSVTLTTSGSRTITATRTSGGAQSGTSGSFTLAAAAAATVDVAAPASSTAGSTFSVTVTARDTFNNVATGYLGTVAFTGGGTGAQLPSNYSFVGGDAGSKTFSSVELRQAGSRTITVTDTVTGSITGNDTITVNAAAGATLEVAAPAASTAGSSFSVDVTARDAFNNIASGYAGTVSFTGGGTGAQLPANYAFVGGDAGVKTFTGVELRQAGSRTVTVTDTVTGSITGNDTITVNPAAAATLEVAAPGLATAGSSFSADVTARDAFGNVATGYLGTVAFSGGGTGAQLPSNYNFVGGDAGTKTFTGVELRQAGSQTITATDMVTGSITGNDTITVNPAAAATLEVAAPASATAGSTFSVDVTARDAFNNIATGYTGTVNFTGGGTGAQLPANYSFTGGDAGVKTFTGVELRQAGSRTVTVTDTVTGTITGNDTITVNPATAATLEVAAPASATAGSTFSVDVTVRDAFNNVATGYLGTVTFTGGGTGAQLPANYTFVGGDAGSKTFGSVELRQAGSRSVTVTDTVTGAITGNDTITVNPATAATLEVAAPAFDDCGLDLLGRRHRPRRLQQHRHRLHRHHRLHRWRHRRPAARQLQLHRRRRRHQDLHQRRPTPSRLAHDHRHRHRHGLDHRQRHAHRQPRRRRNSDRRATCECARRPVLLCHLHGKGRVCEHGHRLPRDRHVQRHRWR